VATVATTCAAVIGTRWWLALALVAGCGRSNYSGGRDGGGDGGTVTAVRCDDVPADGTVAYGDQCFTFHRGPLVQEAAQRSCVELGGNLAELSSAAAEAAVRSAGFDLASEPWIGLSVGFDTQWTWLSERPLGYVNWSGDSTPADFAGVYLDATGWAHVDWGTAKSYLCEVGWVRHPGKAIEYQAIHDPWLTRTAARDLCLGLGGDLASLVDDSDFQAVCDLSFARHWVAATDENGDQIYTWPSGDPVADERWGTTQPNKASGCVTYSTTEQLVSVVCDELAGPLCQRDVP